MKASIRVHRSKIWHASMSVGEQEKHTPADDPCRRTVGLGPKPNCRRWLLMTGSLPRRSVNVRWRWSRASMSGLSTSNLSPRCAASVLSSYPAHYRAWIASWVVQRDGDAPGGWLHQLMPDAVSPSPQGGGKAPHRMRGAPHTAAVPKRGPTPVARGGVAFVVARCCGRLRRPDRNAAALVARCCGRLRRPDRNARRAASKTIS